MSKGTKTKTTTKTGFNNGPRALLIAIIYAAVLDVGGRGGGIYIDEAKAWFMTDDYQLLLELLGLPRDWLPMAIEGG